MSSSGHDLSESVASQALFLNACQHGDIHTLTSFLSPLPSSVFLDGFHLSSQHGHLDVIKLLSTSPGLLSPSHPFIDIHSHQELAFRLACYNGHLEIVKFLTTSPDLLSAGHTFADIHANNDQGFYWACECGHLDIVRFLTTSPDLLEAGHTFSYIHDYAFHQACQNGHSQIVRFLTTSPDLLACGHTLTHPHLQNFYGFHRACFQGHTSLAHFFLTSPELRSLGIPPIPQDHLEHALRVACREGHWDLVRTIVLDSPLRPTPTLALTAQSYPILSEALLSLHEKRTLSDSLDSTAQPIPAAPPASRL